MKMYFTFQYGSIQIASGEGNKVPFIVFTFQYGSIQMNYDELISEAEQTLHSNMVLFKLKDELIRQLRYFFTFQYGSIQIETECLVSEHISLYIPIWFYSNEQETKSQIASRQLYIPIWFYSNDKQAKRFYNSKELYIPIWFYSNIN